ncbi:hypothetical protein [Haliangium sp.]|uniref:hypothetical protein n=1 Tax=Haliangium sp. TaxID=2663208 RepID=UPI003D0CCD23
MPARSHPPRFVTVLAALFAVAAAVAVIWWQRASGPDAATSGQDGESAQAAPAPDERRPIAQPRPRAPDPNVAAGDTNGDVGAGDPLAAPPAGYGDSEYPVDLEYLRTQIPDNVYWRLGAPTEDPEILRQRQEEEARWNQLFGKVQSGTASEAEIRQYYDHRRQLSEDYVEFANLVLSQYGEVLPERDRGLYELGIEMHSTRLAEIPQGIDDALARKREQDQRRQDWQREQGQ